MNTQIVPPQSGIQAIYPANSLQREYISHALSEHLDNTYWLQTQVDYYNPIDMVVYRQAWELAIKTYPTLRTCFNWEESLIQVVIKCVKLSYSEHDVSTKMDKEQAISVFLQADRLLGFDLMKPTLFRLSFIKQSETHFTLLKTMHHMIIDGWSKIRLLKQVHHYYEQLLKGITPNIKQDTAYLRTQAYIDNYQKDALKHWKQKINETKHANDLNSLLSYFADLDAITVWNSSCERNMRLDGQDYDALCTLVNQEGLTLSVMVQFAWHKLIQIYTQDTQTIVGTILSGRNIPIEGIEDSVGLYMNALPLILNWDGGRPILSQLNLIQEKIGSLDEYGFAYLASLQNEGNRLFHSLLVFDNNPECDNFRDEECSLTVRIRSQIEKFNYPLVLITYERNDALHIGLHYDEMYLTATKADVLLDQLKCILRQLPFLLQTPHNAINLLRPEEFQQIVYDWNNTDRDYPHDKTIHQLFEEQVKRTSDNIALMFEDKTLTYRKLNEQSNQLARYIREHYKQQGCACKPDTLIVLCLDRSIEMIVAILGVLKAGGAYVPIDPNYPKARIQYVLEDTASHLILTQTHLKARLNDLGCYLLCVDDSDPYRQHIKTNLAVTACATDLAYVIYTSGTTGMPKGVMVEHRSVCNLIDNWINYLVIHEESVIVQFSSIAFDASIEEIFSALVSGGKLCLVSDKIRSNPSVFSQYLLEQKITVATLPPAYLAAIGQTDLLALETLVVAGESCGQKTMDAWSNNRTFVNAYGPTESTVCTMMHTHRPGKISTVIGKPLFNIKAYVLDSTHNLVPIGVTGELYISGAGLARGYLNQSELTFERFIPNPFATESDKIRGYTRLYKTGDLVRWLSDGNLEYIGRNDFQVKIWGYRIELGEIERSLSTFPGIKHCVVLALEQETHKLLVAYYMSNERIESKLLNVHLSKRLPEYMIPSWFILMEAFPLTINGKLDLSAFPKPNFSASESIWGSKGDKTITPHAVSLKKLQAIW
ncbi:MAG: amino acid adenylation domain-containing protein [Legionellaceae bacterium]|nr:amino acid adenylation domain-containing protein [Legionellaceae bacterium]